MMIQEYYMIGKKEIYLLQMIFRSREYTEENLSVLLDGMDIDSEKMEYLLMLALLGKMHGWLYFPYEIQPRLEGIYRAERFHNIFGIPWLKEKLLLLSEKGIPMMFLKGMAMRSYYAPGFVRQMSDFDLAVPAEQFEEAQTVLLESEHDIEKGAAALHAQHIEKQGKTIDLHQWIFKTCGGMTAGLWEKSVRINFYGVSVHVLNPVDMFIHIIDCKTRDVIKNIQTDRKMKWMFDTLSVIETAGRDNWNWEDVAVRAKELGSFNYLKFLLPFFSEVFPDILKVADLKKFFPQDGDYSSWNNRVSRFSQEHREYRAYISDSKHSNGRLERFWRSLRYTWVSYFYYYGPELKKIDKNYSFVKYFCYTRQVDDIPALIKMYVKRLARLVNI